MSDSKWYISAQNLYEYSIDLAKLIFEDGFRPDLIIGVWRGGTPIGITVHEFLEHCGVDSDHISIRTSSYNGMKRHGGDVKVEGLDYVVDNVDATKSVLIIDDVFDTGLSIEASIHVLKQRCGENNPKHVRIATPFFKPRNNKSALTPDYFIHKTNRWLVFPHELKGLNQEEIMMHKPYVHHTLASLKKNQFL